MHIPKETHIPKEDFISKIHKLSHTSLLIPTKSIQVRIADWKRCRLILQFTMLTAVFYWSKTSLKVNITKNSNKWGKSRNLGSFWVSPLIFVRVDDFQLTLTVTVFINCFFQPHLLIISKLDRIALCLKETIL